MVVIGDQLAISDRDLFFLTSVRLLHTLVPPHLESLLKLSCLGYTSVESYSLVSR